MYSHTSCVRICICLSAYFKQYLTLTAETMFWKLYNKFDLSPNSTLHSQRKVEVRICDINDRAECSLASVIRRKTSGRRSSQGCLERKLKATWFPSALNTSLKKCYEATNLRRASFPFGGTEPWCCKRENDNTDHYTTVAGCAGLYFL